MFFRYAYKSNACSCKVFSQNCCLTRYNSFVSPENFRHAPFLLGLPVLISPRNWLSSLMTLLVRRRAREGTSCKPLCDIGVCVHAPTVHCSIAHLHPQRLIGSYQWETSKWIKSGCKSGILWQTLTCLESRLLGGESLPYVDVSHVFCRVRLCSCDIFA